MKNWITFTLILLVWQGGVMADDGRSPTKRQFLEAKTLAEQALQDYATQKVDELRSLPLPAHDLPEPLATNIKNELTLDLRWQLERVESARERLDEAEKKLQRSLSQIDKLVRQELERRIQSARDGQTTVNTRSSSSDEPLVFETPEALLTHVGNSLSNGESDGAIDWMTDNAVAELSGLMLQQVGLFAAMGQVAVKTGGILGAADGDPVALPIGAGLAFNDLLERHVVDEPSDSASLAFEQVVSRSMGQFSGQFAVPANRASLRHASAVLRSPRNFLREASELIHLHMSAPEASADQPTHQPDWRLVHVEKSVVAIDSAETDVISRCEMHLVNTENGWKIDRCLSDAQLMAAQISLGSVALTQSSDSKPNAHDNSLDSEQFVADAELHQVAGEDSSSESAKILEFYEVGAIVSESLFQCQTAQLSSASGGRVPAEEKLNSGCQELIALLKETLAQPPSSAGISIDHRTLLLRHTPAGHDEIQEILSRLRGGLNKQLRVDLVLMEEDDLESITQMADRVGTVDLAASETIFTQCLDYPCIINKSKTVQQGQAARFSVHGSRAFSVIGRLTDNDTVEVRCEEDLHGKPDLVTIHQLEMGSGTANIQVLATEETFRWVVRVTVVDSESSNVSDFGTTSR